MTRRPFSSAVTLRARNFSPVLTTINNWGRGFKLQTVNNCWGRGFKLQTVNNCWGRGFKLQTVNNCWGRGFKLQTVNNCWGRGFKLQTVNNCWGRGFKLQTVNNCWGRGFKLQTVNYCWGRGFKLQTVNYCWVRGFKLQTVNYTLHDITVPVSETKSWDWGFMIDSWDWLMIGQYCFMCTTGGNVSSIFFSLLWGQQVKDVLVDWDKDWKQRNVCPSVCPSENRPTQTQRSVQHQSWHAFILLCHSQKQQILTFKKNQQMFLTIFDWNDQFTINISHNRRIEYGKPVAWFTPRVGSV